MCALLNTDQIIIIVVIIKGSGYLDWSLRMHSLCTKNWEGNNMR